MRITFLGCGSAFTVGENDYHSNMLLEDKNGERFLIDCGSDARLALYELGLTYKDIDNLYISHLHADHVGGMEWLGICRCFDSACSPPNLYISEDLVSDLWENVLSGGMTLVQGIVPKLEAFYNVHLIAKNSSFSWASVDFFKVKTIHIISNSMVFPCYGLFFNVDGINVFITTDTQFTPDYLMDFYLKADIIFHDCETAEKASGVHSHYCDLITLDPDLKSKMWLYHYSPGHLPDAKKDGFRGFVKKGQSFDFQDKSSLEKTDPCLI